MKFYTISHDPSNGGHCDYYSTDNMCLAYITISKNFIYVYGIIYPSTVPIRFTSLDTAKSFVSEELNKQGYTLLPQKLEILL